MKTRKIEIRLTEEELNIIRTNAKLSGQSMSVFVRTKLGLSGQNPAVCQDNVMTNNAAVMTNVRTEKDDCQDDYSVSVDTVIAGFGRETKPKEAPPPAKIFTDPQKRIEPDDLSKILQQQRVDMITSPKRNNI